jgi:hypothetical protein
MFKRCMELKGEEIIPFKHTWLIVLLWCGKSDGRKEVFFEKCAEHWVWKGIQGDIKTQVTLLSKSMSTDSNK